VSELSLTGKKRPVAAKAGDLDQLILDDEDELVLLDGGDEEMVDGGGDEDGEDDIAAIMAKSKSTSKKSKATSNSRAKK